MKPSPQKQPPPAQLQTPMQGPPAPQQQQQQQQQYVPYPKMNLYSNNPVEDLGYVINEDRGAPRRLPTKNWDPKKPLCACILTVSSGSSYDRLFEEVEQTPPEEGVAISLWSLTYQNLDALYKQLTAEKPEEASKVPELVEIAQDIARSVPESVLLNFECCGGCSDNGFPIPPADVYRLVKLWLDRQHVVAFGDFSTKALIHTWDEHLLGPNPLRRVGELSSNFDLRFDPEVLINCPSAQLSRVGELSKEKGSCHVGALGGTCKFSVDRAKADTKRYNLQVLTIMTHADGVPVAEKDCSVTFKGERLNGAAGHVLLSYPSPKEGGHPGIMLVSAGHWIELMRLDTSIEFVKAQIAQNEGAAAAVAFEAQYNASPMYAQAEQLQSYSKNYVQSAAPVKYGNLSKKM